MSLTVFTAIRGSSVNAYAFGQNIQTRYCFSILLLFFKIFVSFNPLALRL